MDDKLWIEKWTNAIARQICKGKPEVSDVDKSDIPTCPPGLIGCLITLTIIHHTDSLQI